MKIFWRFSSYGLRAIFNFFGCLAVGFSLAMGCGLVGVAGLSSGCASSSSYLIPDGDANSTAEGAAYTGEGMHFRKPMPHRPNPHPWQFYYKHCEQGPSDHVSKTAYSCNEPF